MHTRLHYEMTLGIALEVGICRPAAEAIARADAAVDAGGFARNRYHMRPVLLLGRDRRAQTAAAHLAQAREAAARGEGEAAWTHLGQGLHALQDQATHGPWWLLGIHWGRWLDDPQRTLFGLPDPQQRRLAAMELVTRHYLRRAVDDPGLRECLTHQQDPSSGNTGA